MFYFGFFLIMSVSSVVGYYISKKFIARDLFLKDLISFFNLTKNNVEFKKLKFDELFMSYLKTYKGSFRKEFLFLERVVFGDVEAIENLCLLNQEEKFFLLNFLIGFGEINDSMLLIEINKVLDWLILLEKKAYESRIKNVNVIYKISLSVGLIVFVLIV